jgi:hypothetical protein
MTPSEVKKIMDRTRLHPKVFIIQGHNYEEHEILAVVSSREKAIAKLIEFGYRRNDWAVLVDKLRNNDIYLSAAEEIPRRLRLLKERKLTGFDNWNLPNLSDDVDEEYRARDDHYSVTITETVVE